MIATRRRVPGGNVVTQVIQEDRMRLRHSGCIVPTQTGFLVRGA